MGEQRVGDVGGGVVQMRGGLGRRVVPASVAAWHDARCGCDSHQHSLAITHRGLTLAGWS